MTKQTEQTVFDTDTYNTDFEQHEVQECRSCKRLFTPSREPSWAFGKAGWSCGVCEDDGAEFYGGSEDYEDRSVDSDPYDRDSDRYGGY